MTWVFGQANEDVRRKKLRLRASFFVREISGLIAGALRQRLFGDTDWNSLRRCNMRPEFRFPRSTIFLMWVILAGVLLAIAEAKEIALPYGPTETRSVWNMLPWFIVMSGLLVCSAGAAVWGVLFALKRTGMHRISELEPYSHPSSPHGK
ncbi:MAG TPA: hypothetical protein VJO35_09270 [Terriglobales bacterium]|nr:hypothetical protein [Terriglobales bacterium]